MNQGDGGPDTVLGGPRRDFPSTCWSRFLASPGQEADRAQAMEVLASTYWKPIFAYIRTGWAKSNEDAKDLTQGFFLWMMETGFADRADPRRGRFRAFLKTSLKNFLAQEEERRRALKRGGGHSRIPLDEEWTSRLPVREGQDPESRLDEVWKSELILRALALLEEKLRKEDREECFRIFQDYHLSGSDEAGYRQVAERHGQTEQDVDNALRYAKKRLRAIMADLVAETVGSEEDLREEWELLFGKEGP